MSKKTEFGNEDGYVSVYNTNLNFKSLTFGDFKFARTNKEYKKLNQVPTSLENILFYGKTTNPSYDYYVLVDPIETNFDLEKYTLKTTKIDGHNFVLLISKDAPFGDEKLISESIFRK